MRFEIARSSESVGRAIRLGAILPSRGIFVLLARPEQVGSAGSLALPLLGQLEDMRANYSSEVRNLESARTG
jgi:hypothetical protein